MEKYSIRSKSYKSVHKAAKYTQVSKIKVLIMKKLQENSCFQIILIKEKEEN